LSYPSLLEDIFRETYCEIAAEEYDGRGTNLHEGSGTEDPSHGTKDVQAPQRLGTAATMVSQWWSDGSETPTDEGRHDAYDSDDERYFSDHFIEKLRSRTCSVASDPPTPHSTVPKGRKSSELVARLAPLIMLTVRRVPGALFS
jgi:hypothetical protein